MNRKIPLFLAIALFISLFLEITLFNYTHYATLFTSKHFSLEYVNQRIISNAPEYSLNGIFPQDSLLFPAESISGLEFYKLNTEIASIYVEPVFLQGDNQKVRIIWADEESSRRSIDVSIIKDLDFSNYITIAPRGKVSDLVIVFLENNIAIRQVEINKEIPRAIMPIRMVIVFAISLLLICLKNAELREKISWFCFDYMYDKVCLKQRAGFATLVCSMLIFNFLASYPCFKFDEHDDREWLKFYKHMTDAFLKKQLHLDIKVPQALLEAEKPYDDEYRRQHGMFLVYNGEPLGNGLMPDASYYKGKYYLYHGMVPVIILFAPYKLITGDYLPSSKAAFLFASMATILLMLLWKQIAQNYLKKIPYFFFLVGGAALYASSLIPIFLRAYAVAHYSAHTFVIFGIIILLQAKENLSIKLLLVSSLSFALAVGCRPSALFWSILIPVALWDKRKELMNARYLLAVIIPFVIVGSILAWYNYARFDSPFEFGQAKMILPYNQATFNQTGIIGKIYGTIRIILFTLFNPPNLDLTFPFVTAKESNLPLAKITYMFIDGIGIIVGIFWFPIMWFLFYVRKVGILRNFIFAGIFISLLNMALLSLNLYHVEWRYVLDFSWIIAIGALVCAFQLQEREIAMRIVILKIFYLCCSLTILLAFFFTIYPFYDRQLIDIKIIHYLARTFGVICNVP